MHLCCALTPEDTFSRVEVQVIVELVVTVVVVVVIRIVSEENN